MTACPRAPRGFTLIELMVVTAVSLLLATLSGFIYFSCLKIYKESQGITALFETAKQINRDLRDHLGSVVPIPGNWITPQTYRFPGQASTSIANLGTYYLDGSRTQAMVNNVTYDQYFSGPFDSPSPNSAMAHNGYQRWGTPATWWQMRSEIGYITGAALNTMHAGWTMPGFYGQRNAANATVLQNNDIRAGSWGWPRADYRLDADADDLGAHGNLACRFYTEDRYFNSTYTMALDNANIVLASIKFTVTTAPSGATQTQLSFLKHHICGFDTPWLGGIGMVRGDASYGNMIRSISITPCYLDASGAFRAMDDAELGCALTGALAAGGAEVPRCFDIRYTLMNQANLSRYCFSLRIFCRSNPL